MKRNALEMRIPAVRADHFRKTVMFRFLLIKAIHAGKNIMAEYSKYSHPRAHLKFEDRERLGKAWNN